MTGTGHDAPVQKGWLQHWKETLVLGVPLIGSNLAQMAIHLTDTVMLGWYSVEALAASVLGWTLFFIMYIVGCGFAYAVMPMIASANGAGKHRDVRRSVRMGIWITGIFSIGCTALMLFSEDIFLLLGQDPEISYLAGVYLGVAGWGLYPSLLIAVFRSLFAGLEKANVVLVTTVIAALLNAVLDYAFIFGNFGAPELGIVGAAWASLGTSLVGCLVISLYVIYSPATKRRIIFRRIWRPDWPMFREVMRLGWPIGLTLLAEAGLFSASSIMMGWVGTIPLAAHGIVLQIASVSFMIHLGLANAGTVRVGMAMGKEDLPGLKMASMTVILMSLAVALVASLIFLAFPSSLVGLFVNPEDPDYAFIISTGVYLMIVAAVFQMSDGGQAIALGILRGIKDTRAPMYYVMFSYWVIAAPCSYIAGIILGYGGVGIWAGLAVGLALAYICLLARFWFLARGLKLQVLVE